MFKIRVEDTKKPHFKFQKKSERYLIRLEKTPDFLGFDKEIPVIYHHVFFSNRVEALEFANSLDSYFEEVFYLISCYHHRLSSLLNVDSSNGQNLENFYKLQQSAYLKKTVLETALNSSQQFVAFTVIDMIKEYLKSVQMLSTLILKTFRKEAVKIFDSLERLNDSFISTYRNSSHNYQNQNLSIFKN